MSVENMRIIEIKARLSKELNFNECVSKACKLTQTNGTLIEQREVFFQSKNGRLKLRYQINKGFKSVELIHYNIPNEQRPKLSTYTKMDVHQPELLESILSKSNGQLGILIQKRLLFLHKERIRILLDKVENLGNFIEIEICLRPNEPLHDGQVLIERMMREFAIQEEHLMVGSHFEELRTKLQ